MCNVSKLVEDTNPRYWTACVCPDAGCGAVCSVCGCKSLPELLPKLLPRRSRPPASRRARVATQKPQTPQQGPRCRRQHGVGQPDTQRAVEEHRLWGSELLSLHPTVVSVSSLHGKVFFFWLVGVILFYFLLLSESVDQVVEKYGLQKVTLLREISVKTGIQVIVSPPWLHYINLSVVPWTFLWN